MKSAYPYIHRHPTTGVTELDNGMTLRDYFAGLAMQAILSRADSRFTTTLDYVGGKAYQYANEMMKARENKDE